LIASVVCCVRGFLSVVAPASSFLSFNVEHPLSLSVEAGVF